MNDPICVECDLKVDWNIAAIPERLDNPLTTDNP